MFLWLPHALLCLWRTHPIVLRLSIRLSVVPGVSSGGEAEAAGGEAEAEASSNNPRTQLEFHVSALTSHVQHVGEGVAARLNLAPVMLLLTCAPRWTRF